jgi:hypothetical protein
MQLILGQLARVMPIGRHGSAFLASKHEVLNKRTVLLKFSYFSHRNRALTVSSGMRAGISTLNENMRPVTCTFLLEMIGTKSAGKRRRPLGEKVTPGHGVEAAVVQQILSSNRSASGKQVGVARPFETKHTQN